MNAMACENNASRSGRARAARFSRLPCGRRRGERGQAVVEYALILLLASIAVATSLGVFGTALADEYDDILEAIASL